MDFFVSYTSVDRPWAEWIAWQLEAGGYQVVVQAWDFGAGSDWAHEMQEAMSTAERVVAVLSPDYLNSAHGEAEWRVFYAKDPSGERGLLLPVRVREVDPPGLLKTKVYMDLVHRDAASAREALLAAARGARGKPTDEPEFPGDRGQPAVNGSEPPRFPGDLPPADSSGSEPLEESLTLRAGDAGAIKAFIKDPNYKSVHGSRGIPERSPTALHREQESLQRWTGDSVRRRQPGGKSLIFLSYAEEDVAIAREVAGEFRQKGIDVYDWHDTDNRGGRLIETIEAQIREAEAFVALVSDNYLASPWCRRERELAMLREMGMPDGRPAPGFLYVLKIADTPFGDAGFLQAYDWIDLTNVRDLTEKLAGITVTLRPGGEPRPAVPGLSAAGRESSFFRNRQQELERVRYALTNSAGPHFWLVIAPPQLGKTWLVDRISAMLTLDRPQPWSTKLVDLREYPHERLTDAGLLLGQLFGKAIPVSIEDEKLADIAAEIIASRRPHLCLLDSAELLGKDTAATLRSCLTKIYHYVQDGGQVDVRLAVIIASRRDDEWRGVTPDPRLEALPLTEFRVNVVQETLQNLGTQMGASFEDATYRLNAARVHRLSEGLPALLVRCLEWIQAHQWAGMERLEREELFAELAQPYIEQRLLSQESLIPGAREQLRRERRALEEAFRVLSPYRLFTQSHLRHYLERDPVLKTAMHDADWAIEDLWVAIGGTALLRRPLHEPWQEPQRAIRRLLYRYYYISAQGRIEAHREAQELVRSWTGGLTGKDQIMGIIEWLWHQATVLRLTGSAQPDEELCESASSFCCSLAKSSYSKREIRDYTADVMFNDDELAGVVSGNAVLERLITIIEDIGSTG